MPRWYRLRQETINGVPTGVWAPLQSIYRLREQTVNNVVSGVWAPLKTIYRLNGSGIWRIVFSSLSIPSVKLANPPLLYFRDSLGNETTSQSIASSTTTTPAAYDGDRIYLTRGRWNQDPTTFIMSIQKSQNAGFSSGVSAVNSFSNQITRSYSSYSDSDGTDQIPLSSSNRYTITKDDVRDGFYFRGYIEATNEAEITGEGVTSAILPRMYANVSFNVASAGPPLSYVFNPQTNGGTFFWSYSGNSTIEAQDIYEQEFSVYPLNNTSGTPLYSTTIFPGSGTSSPNSTVTFTSNNLSPNTQYTAVIKTTMNDGWKTNSNISLRTIVTDQESFTTAQARPETPTNVIATDVGTNRPFNNGAVSLSWTQPSGGAAVVGYKIDQTLGPDYAFYTVLVANTGNNSTSGTFTGLQANKNYKFSVTAIGSADTSDPSADSNAVLITTVPDSPTGVNAVAGDALANVSYNPVQSSSNGGKGISFYRATSSPGSITASDVISPIEVTGLTNYTSYTFTVAAYNANGYSAESTASNSVTPQLPRPVGSGSVTIASDSTSNYIYKITSYGTWSNSATSYDYEWQTSTNGTTWTTRSSGTDVLTIPNYNAVNQKTQLIRLRVFGRNQTGPAISPLTSNSLTIFYTTPIINSFNVTGGELIASWTYSYTADDPNATIELEYKKSTDTNWTLILSPQSPGSVVLQSGTYSFTLYVVNSLDGGNRIALTSVNNITVSNLYSFSFGNILYPSTNGHIGLSGGSTSGIPSSGKFLGVFPGDFVGNTSAATGYMLVWSDSTKYVVRFDGYRFGFVGQASYRLEWMATFYSNQSYVDVKIITKGSNISGGVTVGLYNNGSVVAGLFAPYTISQGTTYRVNYDGTVGVFNISYDEISVASPNDIMTTAGTLTGSNDDGFFTITTAQNVYKSPTVSIGTTVVGTTTLSIPFTESNGCDYVTYTVRTGSYSGTIVQSGSALTSPLSISSLTANTTYYITLTPFNYKNQSGSVAQTTATTLPPAPVGSNITRSDGTITPSQPSTLTFQANTPSTNQVTTSWSNGSPITSVRFQGSGAGINTDYTDTTSPFITSDVSSYTSTATYNVTVTNTNSNLLANVSWNQSGAQSYSIVYTSSVFGVDAVTGNNSNSSVSVNIPWTSASGTFLLNSLTLFSGPNLTGSQITYTIGLSAISISEKSSSRSGSTALTYTLPNLITNPAYGLSTSTIGGWTASIATQPNPTGGTYSVISQTAGSASVNSSTGALTAGGLSAGQSSTVTVQYNRSGYNPVNITASGSALNQYTVTYNANGGTVSPSSATVNAGQSVTLPTPSRTNFTFNGWYTASSGGSFVGNAGSSYTPTSSITLFAQWTTVQYTVTWNANGGTVTPSSSTVNAGSSVTAPTPTRSGFTFLAWYDTPFGDFLFSVNAGSSYTPTSSITLYARWTQIVPGPPRSVSLTRNQTTWNGTSWTWNCTWLAPNTGGTVSTYEAYREVGTGTVGNATLSTIANTSTPQTGLTNTSTTFSTTNQNAPRADAYVRACNSGGCSSYVSGNVG